MGEADHPENRTGVRFCLLRVLLPSGQADSRGLKGMGTMKKAPFGLQTCSLDCPWFKQKTPEDPRVRGRDPPPQLRPFRCRRPGVSPRPGSELDPPIEHNHPPLSQGPPDLEDASPPCQRGFWVDAAVVRAWPEQCAAHPIVSPLEVLGRAVVSREGV